jgi:hypothetical protein
VTYAPDGDIVHAARSGENGAACGEPAPGEKVLTWGQATDGDHDPFTCGACWKAIAGGVEPMGGAR